MDIYTISTTIFVMGIIVGFGCIVALNIKITDEFKKGLMFIIINFAVPAIILNGVFNTSVDESLLHMVGVIFIFSIIYHLTALILSLLITRLLRFDSKLATKLSILAAFGNSGFIGVPLCAAIFGPTGGLLAAIFDSALDVVIFTVGIYLLKSDGKFEVKQLKNVINPPLIAIIVGISVAFSGFEAPQFMNQLAEMLATLAAPLAMLYVGMLLPPLLKKRQGLYFYKSIWYPLSFKLIFIPLTLFVIITMTTLNPLLKNIVIILSTMPTFMLATVLFSKYAHDEDTAVVTSIYSTLLSLITIPLIIWFTTVVS